jgi:molybdenum cofactor biosynthesis protein B
MAIDDRLSFRPVRIKVLVISDTRSLDDDKSGRLLVEMAQADGHEVLGCELVRDERAVIAETFRRYAADPEVEVVISTGGTGITGRDVTPEAVEDVADKLIPGFGELFRYLSYAKIGSSTIQSRATAAVVGTTLVFALPGSSGACRDAWEGILRDQLDVRQRPCNFVSLLPRLGER